MKTDGYNRVYNVLQKYKNGVDKENYQQVLGELLAVKDDWEDVRNQVAGYQYNNVISFVAYAYILAKDYEVAYNLLKEGIHNVATDYPEFGQAAKATLFHYLGISQCYLDKFDEAEESFHQMVYWEMLDIFHSSYPKFPHYSFRKISEYSLADLRKNQLSLSPASSFNDPCDTPYFLWAEEKAKSIADPVEKKISKLVTGAYKEFRMRCFCSESPYPTIDNRQPSKYPDIEKPYLDMVMWAHYADYHKGFCAEYVFPSDFNSPKMKNGDLCRFAEMAYKDDFCTSSDITYKDGFFAKGRRWEYEHEKRMMYYTKNRSDVKDFPEIQLTDDCLKAVYIGIKCSEEHKAEIIDIMRNYPHVKLYQMKVSSSNLFKMEAEEIKRKNKAKEDCWLKCLWKRLMTCLFGKRNILS